MPMNSKSYFKHPNKQQNTNLVCIKELTSEITLERQLNKKKKDRI